MSGTRRSNKRIRVYLDSSDYEMFCRSHIGSAQNNVLTFLLEKIAHGEVEVCYSYATVWELFQNYDPTHFESRKQRAEMVQKICGKNAFRFMHYIKKENAFSKEGCWYPGEKEPISLPKVSDLINSRLIELHGTKMNRQQRRQYIRKEEYPKKMRANPDVLDQGSRKRDHTAQFDGRSSSDNT